MAPTFTLPVFNIFCQSWRLDEGPPPVINQILSGQVCQLYVNPRVTWFTLDNFDDISQVVYIRLPRGTDAQEGDLFEVAENDEWYYTALEVERVHRGFPNEYLVVYGLVVDTEHLPGGIIIEETGPTIVEEDGVSEIIQEIFPP